ncbi:hypothetical protein [Pendulispora albinea]|uniref:Phospholipase A(1) n=1 Tax=Pendulispora albinea TaxID=2741071 RepID=A0ABZ2M9Y4_9BACT
MAEDTVPTTFAQDVGGSNPKSIDGQLVKLADDVYNNNGFNEPIGAPIDGWTRMSDDQLRADHIEPRMLHNPQTGFHAEVYRNSRGEHVLAIAGTDDQNDVVSDIMGSVGLNDHVTQATDLTRQLKGVYGDKLACTGHSLGGGACAAAAVANDIPAVTFNAAAVHPNQALGGMGKDVGDFQRRAGNVRAYELPGDVLTGNQNHGILTPSAAHPIGKQIELHAIPPDSPGFIGVLGPAGVAFDHGVQMHGTGAVMKSMDKYPPWVTSTK